MQEQTQPPAEAIQLYESVRQAMERMQNRKTSWVSSVIVLAVSMLLFVGVGTRMGGKQTIETLLILIPILLFHELGHFIAMKVFGYRNVRMFFIPFFIPFFGAAVSGQNYSAPGWKKAVVSLLGPLPGIVVGGVIGVFGSYHHNDLLLRIAWMAIVLNGLNLLPILPMDGGRIVQSLIFSRHYALDIALRVVAAIAMIGGSFLLHTNMFLLFGVFMLISIPSSMKLGRIAFELLGQGIQPPAEKDETIPPAVAYPIIDRVLQVFAVRSNEQLQSVPMNSLHVFEVIAARPPGVFGTIILMLVYVGGIASAMVLAMIVAVAQLPPT